MKSNILVIGGSRNMGLELVKRLLGKDHNIYVAANDGDALKNLNVRYIQFDAEQDLLDMNDLPAHLDGFVYCPESADQVSDGSLSKAAFERNMNINFFNVVPILNRLLPLIKAAENPSIVVCSSVSSSDNPGYQASLSAAKSTLEAYVKYMAAELAPKARINIVAPASTEIHFESDNPTKWGQLSTVSRRRPLLRIEREEDIAHSICFLLSPKSSWMTGESIHLDTSYARIRA